MSSNLLEEYCWEIIGTAITLVFFTFYLYLTWTFDYWKKQGVPGNKPRPILGTIKSLENETLQDQDYASHKKFGKVFGSFEGRLPVLHITDPDMIKQAFVDDASIFTDRRSVKMFEDTPTIGKALTFLKGKEWKQTRAILTPTFSIEKLKQMLPLIVECLYTFIPSLEIYANNKESFNAKDIFSSFTLDVIGNCAFATKTDSIKNPHNQFKNLAEKVVSVPHSNLSIIFPKLHRILTWFVRPFAENPFKFFKRTARNLIEARRNKNPPQKINFIDLLLQAEATEDDKNTSCNQNKKEKILTRDVMVAQCIQFLLAGHNTTATTLAMIAYCLALNPAVQERLISEIDETIMENKGIIDYEKISKLQYMDMVISETLRLYNPITRIERTCSQDEYNLDGVILQKNMLVIVSPFSIHHDEQHYPDPEKFDPERFSPEYKENKSPYTYLPFGIGPRMCIGMQFALMEMKLTLSYVLSNYRFQACSETKIPMSFTGNRLNILLPRNVTLAIQKRIDKPSFKKL